MISGSTGLKRCRCLLIMAIFGRYMPVGADHDPTAAVAG
jgi:hypothetical protein